MGGEFEKFCGGPFWNETLLLNNSWPEFTRCFQSTVLVWVPTGFLWLCAAFYIPYILSQKDNQRLPLSTLNIAKTFCSSIQTLLSLVLLFHFIRRANKGEPVPTSIYLCYILQATTYISTIILVQIDRLRGVFTSWILFVFWVLELFSNVIPFYTIIMQKEYQTDMVHFVLFFVTFACIIVQSLLQFVSDVPKLKPGYEVMDKHPCPEVTASFPSTLTFWWMTKLVITGYRKGIEEQDLWDLNPREKCSTLVPQFEQEWTKEKERIRRENLKRHLTRTKPANGIHYNNGFKRSHSNEHSPLILDLKSKRNGSVDKSHLKEPSRTLKNPSLFRVLWKLVYPYLVSQTMTKLVADLCMLAGPVLMSGLISFIRNKDDDHAWKGYVLATAMLLLYTVRSVFYQNSMNSASITGMHVKTILIAAIYKKSLTQTYEARKMSTTGEIVNMMSVDCQRLNDVFNYLFLLWTVPVQIILTVALLYNTIGVSVFAGVLVLVVLIPLNAYFGSLQRRFQTKNLHFKDKRIKLVNEILNGIKVLKLYAWEASFKDKVDDIRKNEMKELFKIAYINVCTGFSWTVAPFLVILATFASYILEDPNNHLDANKAFVTLALFSILRVPMNLLSAIISFTVQAYVSTNRIASFLCSEDLDSSNVIYDNSAENAVEIQNGTFTWDRPMTNTLRDINLKIPEGTLVAIVGHVGSGKSSLLSAILGEMEKLSGKVTVKSSIAYVPQQAWIQNATLRENVLFGKKFREKKYQTVIRACALEPDLAILGAGDQTEIGEKGINLSGGQKQRVSLARAVYSNSDIYLLDDPLSAVDSHVGKHIFTNVIGSNGLLKQKTRVLITHGIHWLPQVDYIVVLGDGVITEAGSYDDLVSHDGPFAQFLKTYLIETNEDEEDPEVQLIRDKMLDRLDSVTSDVTSADEGPQGRRRRHTSRSRSFVDSKSISMGTKRKVYPKNNETGEGKLTQIESVETGKVRFSVFLTYGRAAGLVSFLFALFLFLVFQAVNTGASFFLTRWTDDSRLDPNNSTLPEAQYESLNERYLGFFALFGLVMVITGSVYSYLFWTRLTRAAGRIHDLIMSRIFHSPMSFFDTTPMGRIVNRLSRDVETIDNTLPLLVRMFVATFAAVVATVVTICINTPMFITVMVPLLILYYFIQNFYIPTSRQLKRIESVTRSPIYVHFSETLTGASSIRAYNAVDRFVEETKRRVDRNQVFFFGGVVSNRWLAYYLDWIGTSVIFASAIFALVTPGVSAGVLGLSVSYALQISGTMGWMVRQISDIETNIVSVERVKEYSELPSEAEWYKAKKPPGDWPQTGRVELWNYTTRYREGLDLVLKGVTCIMEGGQKVGIVGRTGAGKSSFTLALFRILEAAGGSIIIDGVNIADIGLHDLRSRLTILPQDPVLFSGTLRMNLDPFEEFSDEDVWRALDQAHLKRFVLGTQKQLMYECGEGGENLSVGQRQLVCLARALLRHTKVLVLDEATAAVDMETDSLIQKTIRDAFSDCTIVTIAHRLNTIMDYDRIVVMDSGKIVEFDNPNVLLADKNTAFYGMAKNAGLV